jgi:hypothetical protein
VTDRLQIIEPKIQITPAQMEQLSTEEDHLTGFLERFFNFQSHQLEIN